MKFAPPHYHTAMRRFPRPLTRLCLIATTIAGVTMTWSRPAPAEPPTTKPTRMRVMTYNIHHGEGEDKRIDLPRLAAIIKAADPDVVALQEVDNKTRRSGNVDQGAELGRLTGLRAQFSAAMPYQGGEYGQAILSKHPTGELTVHRLPQTVSTEPRIAMAATITPGSGVPPFRFVGTHLSANRDPSERDLQAKALAEALAADRSLPTILVGDTNAVPGSDAIRHLGVGETWENATGDDFLTSPRRGLFGRSTGSCWPSRARGRS